jgi:diacylglycerol kinase family enzyme
VNPWFFIVDPSARRLWPTLVAELRRLGVQYEFEWTQGALTGVSFARQAIRAGARLVVAVGGDSTLNEVVNGFFLDGEPLRPDASVALIPAGSSDVARSLAIPGGLAALGLLSHGRALSIDLGVASFEGAPGHPDLRYFVNTAGVGISGRFGNAFGLLERVGGPARQLLAGASVVADPSPWRGSMGLDGGAPEGLAALSVVIALGPYAWGGLAVAPPAKMDDGFFDVVTIGPMARVELLRLVSKVAVGGSALSHPHVRHARAREVRITPDGHPLIQIDGDVVGEGAVDFHILPGAIRIMVPPP